MREPEEVVASLQGVSGILSLMQDAIDRGSLDYRLPEALGVIAQVVDQLCDEVAEGLAKEP